MIRAAWASAFALVVVSAAPARAADLPPAAAAFETAWAAIQSYTATVTVHETKGTDVQDRVYRFAFLKPADAKIDVIAGAGKGGGAVWTGGDRLRGHQGGLLSGIKLSIPINDPLATSLRGDTIVKASFQSAIDEMRAGTVDPATPEATIDGVATDAVTVTLPPATAPDAATREVIDLSRATHLPVRRSTYAGPTLVKEEDFRDVKINPGLSPADFS